MTKLSRYADGIMEASWLAAVIIVPLIFNVYSSRIFEPDKISFLRSLTLIILAAWIIKLYEDGNFQGKNFNHYRKEISKILRIPLVIPVSGLTVIYLLATLFSITPAASLWGSYQRLQGTYTFFSYLILFAAMVANIRRRVQIDRLITTIILTSLPISLYGVLQRYRIDPIPWGGDVSQRIASNLGNSIFVGAYLIMVFPITVMRIVESFESLLEDSGTFIPNFIKATGYVFIIALQVIALYLSGSRGPWLGWAGSLVFIWLSLSLIWKKKWLTLSGVIFSIIIAIFLIGLNISGGPLEGIRNQPGITRISQLLDVESRTGKVRTLIWQGAFDLVNPHDPLTFPDGNQDSLNSVRLLFGYGPESMYVAFNPFYPPELTQVEKRNASPDRSHNETWDSLITTGLIGLFFYLYLFGSLFFFGLMWLGFIKTQRQKFIFFGFTVFSAVVTTILFISWKGWGFFGVALPSGIIFGMILYLLLFSIGGDYESPVGDMGKFRSYYLSGLLAAVLAHFTEINFGIAIAATRTYFWTYAALILILGYLFIGIDGITKIAANGNGHHLGLKKDHPSNEELHFETGKKKSIESRYQKGSLSDESQKKKKRRIKQLRIESEKTGLYKWTRTTLVFGIIISIILITLGFNFITNSSGSKLTGEILRNSLIRMRNPVEANTYGVLILIGVFWSFSIFIAGTEIFLSNFLQSNRELLKWGKLLGIIFIVSLLISTAYWILQASLLASLARNSITTLEGVLTQVEKSFNLIHYYNLYIALVIFGAALFLPEGWPGKTIRSKYFSYAITLMIFSSAIVFISISNIRVIEADMAYKSGETFSKSGTWPVAIAIFDRAIEKAPKEDFYYLFLGRAYLEHAKELGGLEERELLINQAAEDLQKAQKINPLNTDHTANLARLYSLWASISNDPIKREERASLSSSFFETAVSLSPNNARIWDEWALHFLSVGNQPDEALPKLLRSLELDPNYEWTYGLLGDYYAQNAEKLEGTDPVLKDDLFDKALENYMRAVELTGETSGLQKSNYYLAIAGIYSKLGNYPEAIQAYEQSITSSPDRVDLWQIHETLSKLNYLIGKIDPAIQYAKLALSNSPEDQRLRIEEYLNQLSSP